MIYRLQRRGKSPNEVFQDSYVDGREIPKKHKIFDVALNRTLTWATGPHPPPRYIPASRPRYAARCPAQLDTLQSTLRHSDSTSREDPDSRSENQDIYDVYEQTAPTNEKRSKEHKHTNRIREGQGQNAYVGEFHAD